MKYNYHTHTLRCNHAVGSDEEYIKTAVKNDITILGFSDHAPIYQDVISDFQSRMHYSELDEYVNSITKLREKYASSIQICIGLEMEYYPLYFNNTVRDFSAIGVEYLILGQHCLGNQTGDVVCRKETTSIVDLKRYVCQTIEALKTEKFLYFAHPDIFNFIGDRNIYQTEMRKICEVAKALNIPLEINLSGIIKKRHYPNPDFWQVASEIGNDVVMGYDAHNPDMIADKNAEELAMNIIKSNNLNVVEADFFFKSKYRLK